LQTSEFPLEIPRSQKRNIQYTTTLGNIAELTKLKIELLLINGI
jgi:hypothetical protein